MSRLKLRGPKRQRRPWLGWPQGDLPRVLRKTQDPVDVPSVLGEIDEQRYASDCDDFCKCDACDDEDEIAAGEAEKKADVTHRPPGATN